MNNEHNAFLKEMEEIQTKKFKNDKGYLESCKANKDLNPRDYKIQPNHKLDEYFNKYGHKLGKGNLLAFKANELWLMNKRTNYWKIENDSDFVYFEAPTNLKPLFIGLASLLVACSVATGVYFGLFANKNSSTNNGETDDGDDDGGGSEETNYYFNQLSLASDCYSVDNYNLCSSLDDSTQVDKILINKNGITKIFIDVFKNGAFVYPYIELKNFKMGNMSLPSLDKSSPDNMNVTDYNNYCGVLEFDVDFSNIELTDNISAEFSLHN